MEVELLIQSAMGLIVVLAILIYLFFFAGKKNKKEVVKVVKEKPKKVDKTTLQHLRTIVKNRETTQEELQKALKSIIKYHGTIHPKLGIRTHPDFEIYKDIIVALCKHPNTSKDLIIKFDKDLEARNPNYSIEINKALTQGLNSRV
jgi:Na+-transporting methylmalonyl-CoA/oxaloacetate decarboxylase gamma subunit